jgi:hypothetical protein
MTHHMIVYGCKDSSNQSYVSTFRNPGEVLIVDVYSALTYLQCSSPIGNINADCVTIGFIWSVGTAALEMPAGVGIRIGNAVEYAFSHVVIE